MKILIEELSKVKKNYSFLTEESGKIENKDRDKIWIIDPIDGTTNFLHGIPHFAISIALKVDNDVKKLLLFMTQLKMKHFLPKKTKVLILITKE